MGNLVLNGATSGATTLQPTDATTQTITLPANSGTVITTASSGQVIPTAALPAGSVLQVVNGYWASQVTTSSTSYVDTNLTATITPTSSTSKILVLVSQNGMAGAMASQGVNLRLVRNSTTIETITIASFYGGANLLGGVSTSWLDSPATTTALTYKTQFANYTAGGGIVYVQADSDTSTITLLEIAA